jgi:molecular chaperone GrpE
MVMFRDMQTAETAGAPDKASLAAALRELEAARSRVERDARNVSDDMRKQLVERLLPVLDNLDRTIAAAAAEGDAPAVLEGARMVREQLAGVLASYGLERLDAEGQWFDPAVHDAIATAPVGRDHHDVVIEQIAPGYRFGSHLLRPAKVVVGRFR